MAAINEKILKEILTLPADVRGMLIEKLIESLNTPIAKEIDEIWTIEANKRLQAIQRGKVSTLDGEEVITKIRKRLAK